MKANHTEAQNAALMFNDFIFTVINVFFSSLYSVFLNKILNILILEIKPDSWADHHVTVPYAGSPLCHILWPIPSKTSSCANALSLLAQPEATRSHQWIQGAAVHRSAFLYAAQAAHQLTKRLPYSLCLFFSLPPYSFQFAWLAWNPIHCQHIECHNAINKPAVKVISTKKI